MTGDHDRYRRLSDEAMELYRSNPAAFQSRLLWLTVCGYSFVIVVLLLFATIFAAAIWYAYEVDHNIIWLVIFITSGITIFFLLKSFFVPIPKPSGIELSREDVPGLFADLDVITNALQLPSFKTVLLGYSLDAAIYQSSKMNFYGRRHSCLTIGLPLLQALSREEFRAVISHEIVNGNYKNGKYGNNIRHTRNRFAKIKNQFIIKQLFSFLFIRFSPLYIIYASVLQRMDELKADSYAVQFASAESLASGMSKLVMLNAITMLKVWNEINLEYIESQTIPDNIITRISSAIKSGLPKDVIDKFQIELKRNTGIDDRKFCLRSRLAMLGIRDLSSPASIDMLLKSNSYSAACELLDGKETVYEIQLNKKIKELLESYIKSNDMVIKNNIKDLRDYREQQKPPAKDEWNEETENIEIDINCNDSQNIMLRFAIFGVNNIKNDVLRMMEKWPNEQDYKYYHGVCLLNENNDDGLTWIADAEKNGNYSYLDEYDIRKSYFKRSGRDAEYYDLFGLQYVINNYEVDDLKRIYLLDITGFPLFVYND